MLKKKGQGWIAFVIGFMVLVVVFFIVIHIIGTQLK
jgi:hypothetical protein